MNKIQQFKKEEAETREISSSYSVANYLTKRDCENVSLAVSQAEEHSETTKNIESDRVYYVLEGKLVVTKEDEEYVVREGDVIFISKDTKYHFEGTFKAILINSPAFDPGNEQILDK